MLAPKLRRLSHADVLARLKKRTDYDPVMLLAGIKAPKIKNKQRLTPEGRKKVAQAIAKWRRFSKTTYGIGLNQGDLARLGFMRGRTVRG